MRRVVIFFCTIIGLATSFVIANGSSTAHAGTCTFTSGTAFADGQQQSVITSGCDSTAAGTGPLGSMVAGDLNFADGTVSGKVLTQGDATVSLGGNIFFDVTAKIPQNSVFPGQGANSNETILQIGNITYDVTRIDFTVSGTEKVTVNNSSQALGAFVGLNFSVGAGQGVSSNGVPIILGGLSARTNAVTCGSGFTICNSFNQPWSASSEFSLSAPFGVQLTDLSHVDFATTMSERIQLSSDMPLSNNPSIDAADPFTITSMELLDANGVPIPGVTFVADDGTVFADAADATATPLPAALPLFATGLGGLGLFGWRKKREAQAAAA